MPRQAFEGSHALSPALQRRRRPVIRYPVWILMQIARKRSIEKEKVWPRWYSEWQCMSKRK
eukprot:8830079-Alexandrium_andersonii.AAC.1